MLLILTLLIFQILNLFEILPIVEAIAIENYYDEATFQVSSCDFNSNSADKGAVLYCIPNPYGNVLNPFDSCTMEDNHSSTGKDTVYCNTSSNTGHAGKFWFGIGFACFAGVAVIDSNCCNEFEKTKKDTNLFMFKNKI